MAVPTKTRCLVPAVGSSACPGPPAALGSVGWGRLCWGSSTATLSPAQGKAPNRYLPDFTEGFSGLPYLFQSSLLKVCITARQTNCLGKGDLQRGEGWWYCFTWPVTQWGGWKRSGSFLWGRRAALVCPGRQSRGFIILLLLQPRASGLKLK